MNQNKEHSDEKKITLNTDSSVERISENLASPKSIFTYEQEEPLTQAEQDLAQLQEMVDLLNKNLGTALERI